MKPSSYVQFYHPQLQSNKPITYLSRNVDSIMEENNCQNIITEGYTNNHLIQQVFNDMTTVQGLLNHVDFPTHISKGSLDPVLSDLAEEGIQYRPLD